MEAKTETTTDPKRSYLCFTCEVSTRSAAASVPIAARWYGVELRGARYGCICVLAKNDRKHGLRALTFANVKQAEAARDRYENASGRLGFVIGRRPYYVRIGR